MKEGLKILPKALREKKRYVVFSGCEGKEVREKVREMFGEFGLEKCESREIGKNVLKCNLKGLNEIGSAIVLLGGKILKVSGTIKASRKK